MPSIIFLLNCSDSVLFFFLSFFFSFFCCSCLFYASSPFRTPETPIELAIDFILHDFEMAGTIRSILTVNSLLDSEKKIVAFQTHTQQKRLFFIYFLLIGLCSEIGKLWVHRGRTNIHLRRFWGERIFGCRRERVRLLAVQNG